MAKKRPFYREFRRTLYETVSDSGNSVLRYRGHDNKEYYVASSNDPDVEPGEGKSAYQSYVDTTTDDPVKTETEWVASLKGADGVDLGEVAIADNLTTDDATKVLSAKQGHKLNQQTQHVADKDYAPSTYNGLGRTSLKKNMVEGVNVLTSAMISTDNTEYFIQYDYDLDGATVTLPANASLVFMGGSIKNGTLIGNNTRIQAKKGVCIFDGITIQGTWDVAEAYSSWFKTHKAGYKIASVNESGTTLYKGSDNNYYALADLTLVDSTYYVTSTLEGGEVVEDSISITSTNYATFRVEGDNTDYVAAVPSVPGTFPYTSYNGVDFTTLDDTAPLQNLFDLRAKKTIIEDGVYMIKANSKTSYSNDVGLYYDGHNDSELVLEGWLKAIPNNLSKYHLLDVIGCCNIRITGNGGVQGDLLEHTGTSGEAGHVLSVSNTKNMTVEGLTFAYAWGDNIYCHWWSHGRTSVVARGNDQMFHTYNGVKVIYGGRTGLVYERGDNVVIDSCYFYGNGRVRGKSTNSAVDIEPFNYADTPKRYVENYEFKNNVFENSANGLRLERCVNCSVHGNKFDFGWSGINVIRHKEFSYDITSSDDRGWVRSYMRIYDNIIKRCTNGISLGTLESSENTEVYGNTLISCNKPIGGTPIKSHIHDNVTYGCGQWEFGALIDTDVSYNKNYACKMPVITAGWGNGRIITFGESGFSSSKNSTFHDNWFSLDYGKSFFGLGVYGKEEFYHGLPVGYRGVLTYGVDLTQPSKVHFYNNYTSDDLHIYWGWDSSDYQGNAHFEKGLGSVRTESSEVFLKGDTFKSNTYGDEGLVVKGCILSQSWLDNVRDFANMSSGDTVAYGEVIKSGSYYYVCSAGGTVGETLTGGTASFLSEKAYAAPGGSLKIAFKTRGVCTSETRPSTFLFAGRRMWETDTNKEVVYNGTTWVYNDIYTEE